MAEKRRIFFRGKNGRRLRNLRGIRLKKRKVWNEQVLWKKSFIWWKPLQTTSVVLLLNSPMLSRIFEGHTNLGFFSQVTTSTLSSSSRKKMSSDWRRRRRTRSARRTWPTSWNSIAGLSPEPARRAASAAAAAGRWTPRNLTRPPVSIRKTTPSTHSSTSAGWTAVLTTAWYAPNRRFCLSPVGYPSTTNFAHCSS